MLISNELSINCLQVVHFRNTVFEIPEISLGRNGTKSAKKRISGKESQTKRKEERRSAKIRLRKMKKGTVQHVTGKRQVSSRKREVSSHQERERQRKSPRIFLNSSTDGKKQMVSASSSTSTSLGSPMLERYL